MVKVCAITPVGKQDYLTECIVEGLLKNNCEIVATDSGNGLISNNKDHVFVDRAKNWADIILVFWSKKRDPGPRRHLLKQINKPEVTAYIDGSEYNCMGQRKEKHPWLDPVMQDSCKYYFKRECFAEDMGLGVIPLPFAARNRDFISGANLFDIFIAFGQNKIHPIRAELEKLGRRLQSHGKRVVVGPVANNEYQKITSESLIGVNAHGGGQDCMRFWEILAAGSACFSQRLTIEMPHPFTNNENVVWFDTIDEFNDKAHAYLADRTMLTDLAYAGYKHTQAWHTTKARARYLLDFMGHYPVKGN